MHGLPPAARFSFAASSIPARQFSGPSEPAPQPIPFRICTATANVVTLKFPSFCGNNGVVAFEWFFQNPGVTFAGNCGTTFNVNGSQAASFAGKVLSPLK